MTSSLWTDVYFKSEVGRRPPLAPLGPDVTEEIDSPRDHVTRNDLRERDRERDRERERERADALP
ncbi:hypothetical protein EYF80_041623 [Liparis tanakae]|uniref:Uncharacterized protein n=1 Tax=Liparis tanakae TaxID=230148 RepID=A0A4Z2G4M8_9TELE|nr:hypothetical protein EYF80_041623 [Liparis tanakae]